MKQAPFSIILLPTLRCDADCSYCFEKKSDRQITFEQLRIVMEKVLDHLVENHIETLAVYWQGGEVMTLEPEWFEAAHEIIATIATDRNRQVVHYLQSNMIGYNESWDRVLRDMFGGSAGTSMDYPNLHRKLKKGSPEEFDRIWSENVRKAREAGIEVGVISIPNEQTLDLGAERFYKHFVDELNITEFQVNTPFPGGAANDVKSGYPLDTERLSGFLSDLARIWMERGFHRGVKIGPFDRLLEYFLHGSREYLCIWRENCVNDFICIDPNGYVAQCDCWVTSYPEFRFGNILEPGSLSELLRNSSARRDLQRRPGVLIEREDCLECKYLAVCHGGCPVRTFSIHGDLFRKDPYCDLYRKLFRDMEDLANGCAAGGQHLG